MPIVISRSGEQAVAAAPLSAEQREKAWEYILKKYLDKHPEVLRDIRPGEAST